MGRSTKVEHSALESASHSDTSNAIDLPKLVTLLDVLTLLDRHFTRRDFRHSYAQERDQANLWIVTLDKHDCPRRDRRQVLLACRLAVGIATILTVGGERFVKWFRVVCPRYDVCLPYRTRDRRVPSMVR